MNTQFIDNGTFGDRKISSITLITVKKSLPANITVDKFALCNAAKKMANTMGIK